MEMVTAYRVARLATGMVANLRSDLFAKLTALALPDLRTIRSGEAVSRLLSDVERLELLARRTLGAALSLISLAAILATLAVLNLRLTLISLALIPVYSLAVRPLSRRVRQLIKRRQLLQTRLSCAAQEVIAGAEVIKGNAAEALQTQQFSKTNREYRDNERRVAYLGDVGRFLAEALAIGGGLGMMTLVGYELSKSRISPDTLIAYLAGCALLLTTTGKVGKAHIQLKEFSLTFRRVEEIFELPDEPSGTRPFPASFRGSIAYENVCFSYRDSGTVLRNVSLQIQPGEVLALVGPSGAGKTTLANLLPRFYQPSSGAIMLGGHNIADYRLDGLRAQIATVPQDPYLFDASLRDNMRLGRWQASDEEILAAARLACVDSFAFDLLQGYQSEVGERGLSLSGGQRQRVAVARALLRRPAILILDEATSMVDGETETRIYEGIRKFMRGVTCLWITHRQATAALADRVAFMQAGAVEAVDTHDALLAACPAYVQFWRDRPPERILAAVTR